MADYIRREDALKALSRSFIVSDDLYGMGVQAGLKYARCKIEQILAADVAEVVHGEWVYSRQDNTLGQFDIVKCSRCGYEAYTIAYYVRAGKYCINCGAKMDGGTENG